MSYVPIEYFYPRDSLNSPGAQISINQFKPANYWSSHFELYNAERRCGGTIDYWKFLKGLCATVIDNLNLPDKIGQLTYESVFLFALYVPQLPSHFNYPTNNKPRPLAAILFGLTMRFWDRARVFDLTNPVVRLLNQILRPRLFQRQARIPIWAYFLWVYTSEHREAAIASAATWVDGTIRKYQFWSLPATPVEQGTRSPEPEGSRVREGEQV